MSVVTFIQRDGAAVTIEAEAGERLLDVAQAAGQPLEGTCDGAMACATCHVVVAASDYARFPAPGALEEDMLDFADAVTATSRLACQLLVDGKPLTVRVP